MKKTHALSFVLIFVIALLAFAPNSFAADDTVKYRLAQSWLPDSSLIRYELGSICHIQGATRTYLQFSDTSGTFANLWKSAPFTCRSNDTLCFFRFASFDNQHQVQVFVDDTSWPPDSSLLAALNLMR